MPSTREASGPDTGAISVRRVQPAYQQVADQLRGLILSTDLKVGARLPSEATLTSLFGVSRSTVREALRVLASQNLITTSRGVSGGSFVAYPEPAEITGFLATAIAMLNNTDRVSVDELIEARELLELPATRMAAKRHAPEDIQRMREVIAHQRKAGNDGDGSSERLGFHQLVLSLSGNRVLELIARPIFTVLRARHVSLQRSEQFWLTIASQHDDIVNSIERRDADTAAISMHEHLDFLASTYKSLEALNPAPNGTAG